MSTDLDRLLALAQAATPGPWQVMFNRSSLRHVETQPGFAHAAGMPVCSIPKAREHDADFIAACDPATITALVKRLQAANLVCERAAGLLHDAEQTLAHPQVTGKGGQHAGAPR